MFACGLHSLKGSGSGCRASNLTNGSRELFFSVQDFHRDRYVKMKLIPVGLSVALLLLCFSGKTAAIPMLSADGSELSEVNVGGVLYDVTFGDGVASTFYPISLVNSTGWFDFAHALTTGIVDALNSLASFPDYDDIAGCNFDSNASLLTNTCLVIIPDTVSAGLFFAESVTSVFGGAATNSSISAAIGVSVGTDTGSNSFATLATFRLTNPSTTVPLPATVPMVLVSLLMLVLFRRKSNIQ